MPDAITEAFVNKYGRNVHMQVQQRGSRFYNKVAHEDALGSEAFYVDRLGPFTGNTYADREAVGVRHQATPINDTPHSKRLISPIDFDWGTILDKFDKVRMLMDPMSRYIMNARDAISRDIDVEILTAVTRTALDKSGASVDIGAAQQVNTGAGGLAEGDVLNLEVILAVEEAMNALEVPADGRIWPVRSDRWRQLKSIPQIQDIDLNAYKILSDPQSTATEVYFNGFWFVRTELTPNANISPIFQRDGIVWGDWTDIQANIEQDPTRKYSWVPYFCMTGGAVRVEEERVIELTYAA